MGWATSAPRAASEHRAAPAVARLMHGAAGAASAARVGAGESQATGATHDVAVMLLVQMAPGARLWGLLRLVVGRFAMRGVHGLRFFRILGSGHEGGFGLRPSADRLGLFAVFADAVSAEAFVANSRVVQSWRARARESGWLRLAPYASRGAWAGCELATSARPPDPGPIAVLTRASIRPTRAAAFWRRAPDAERALHEAPGCLLATGLGEAPLLRQATFSVWQDAESLHAYAQQGAHLEAVRAAYGEGYFSESMFTRFRLLAMGGTWKGRPLG